MEVGGSADMVGAKVHESVQYIAYTVISMIFTPTYNAERPAPIVTFTMLYVDVISKHSCTPFNTR